MQVTASAPGKAILFGEHAVVYGKPAIAIAVDRRARITIKESKEDKITVKIPDLGLFGSIDENGHIIHGDHGEAGILEFISSALSKSNLNRNIIIEVDLGIPIGAGLGSSAAITVATLKAAHQYKKEDLNNETLADMAHKVELEVQGSASPLDTTLSTYGGAIYLSKEKKPIHLEPAIEIPLVVGYTYYRGNTGILVSGVQRLREKYPNIVNPILDSMELITNEAKKAITQGNEERIGDLMNINHGLLDSIGVNTTELSKMVYCARKAGALGSKITGAGGGGSIIAYCPGKTQEVLKELESIENAFQVGISSKGVTLED